MRLILLPGLDGTGELFSDFIEDLSDIISVTCINYPERDCLGYSGLVEYVRSRLPINEDFVLLAESFSGPIAFRLAQLELKHLRAIIFVASFLRNPNRRFMWLTRILPLTMLLRFSPPDFLIRKWLIGEEVDGDLVKKIKSILRRLPIKIIKFRLSEIYNLVFEGNEKKITISFPVYYIKPLQDRLVLDDNYGDFEKIFTNMNLFTLTGPHFILQSKSRDCANYVNQCVTELMKERKSTKGL